MEKKYRTIETAIKELKGMDANFPITKHFIRASILDGVLPATKIGNAYVFDMDDLINIIEVSIHG